MGGDGGVIASNRRYLRGAGTAADKTAGDRPGERGGVNGGGGDPAVLREQRARDLRTCALTQRSLGVESSEGGGDGRHHRPVVACPYGRLYDKEAALEALLRKDSRLSHVRGLRDLVDVRFHWSEQHSGVPTCPISEKELNGFIPAVVIVPGNPHRPNVVAERSLRANGTWEDEYGPLERTLRLVPAPAELDVIRKEWLEHMRKSAEAVTSKKTAKKSRKRTRAENQQGRGAPPNNGEEDATGHVKKQRTKHLPPARTDEDSGGGGDLERDDDKDDLHKHHSGSAADEARS